MTNKNKNKGNARKPTEHFSFFFAYVRLFLPSVLRPDTTLLFLFVFRGTPNLKYVYVEKSSGFKATYSLLGVWPCKTQLLLGLFRLPPPSGKQARGMPAPAKIALSVALQPKVPTRLFFLF